MVPEWLQGSKKEPFWVTLGCVFGLFCYVFCVTFQCLCSRCGDFSSYFLLQIVTRCSYYILICYVFNVYTYSVDVVEVAPPGAAEDHRSCWDMQTQDHHFCCISVC